MVLPTDYHWALRGWLRSKRVKAGELGSILIVGDLDALLRVAGSPRRLTDGERELVDTARALQKEGPSSDLAELRGSYFGRAAPPEGYVKKLRDVLDEYRASFPDCTDEEVLDRVEHIERFPDPLDAWLQDPFGSRVHALLLEVCDELGAVGVPAQPMLGLGVAFGDELLAAELEITDTDRLYELMADDGYRAKPDRSAPTFRDRPWPDEQSAVFSCAACGESVDMDGVDKYGSDHCGANDDVHAPEPPANKPEDT